METVPATTGPPDQAEPPAITATRYFAYDLREDVFLAQQGDGDAKLYPASITKLLSCYVILQHVKPETEVVVGDALALVQPDSSVADLKEGDKLTMEQLIAAMLLPSGNDAAQVAAVAAGRAIAENEALDYTEAAKVFVEEMNRQAKALGMENSHFVSPDGYHDDNHYTSMNDLVTLCKTVLKNPTILKYTGMAKSTVTLSGRELEWENTNILLDSEKEFYHPNTIGMKTGYTSKAGNCLVSAFFMEDRLLLIGVFGCPAFTDDRYLDTLAIYNNL
jgi:D-alanyl-D-alanine carboxypeptidase (penicillin-binding protein 5/6)